MTATPRKAKRANDLGPTGERVRENVRKLRERRGLSTYALAKDLESLGRPIPASGITSIESPSKPRRIDVDDLVALSLALDVSPNRLLLTDEARDSERVDLTAEVQTSELTAWRWARGEQTMFTGTASRTFDGSEMDRGREMYYRRASFPGENRPDVGGTPPAEIVGPHWNALQDVWRTVDALAKEMGCTFDVAMELARKAQPATITGPVRAWEVVDDGQH